MMMVKKMGEYKFTLTFALPPGRHNPELFEDDLFEAGCDDAVIGTGMQGYISLDFIREASSADEAINSAIKNVKQAIPGAELTEVGPDLVSLTDVAHMIHCSRQNVRKYMQTYTNFPRPIHTSGNVQLWHLLEIALFPKFKLQPALIQVAKATFRLNLDIQEKRYKSRLKDIA